MAVYTGPTVKPMHADLNKVPAGDDGKPAVVVMSLPSGKQVWKRHLIRAKRVPVEKDGAQQWKLHPTTAQPMWPLWKNERREFDQLFTMESDGHNNIYVQDYVPPSQEETERLEREQRAAAFRDDLSRLAVENGVSAEVLFARLMEARDSADAEAPPSDPFPRKAAGVSMWELSNGTKFRGSKADADSAEAALNPPEL